MPSPLSSLHSSLLSVLRCSQICAAAAVFIASWPGLSQAQSTNPGVSQRAEAARLLQMPGVLQQRAKPVDQPASPRDQFEIAYDLFIRYTDGTIFNPARQREDKVSLRAYQQRTDKGWNEGDPNASRFLAPSVVMKPGQTVRFRLHNQLPEQTQEQCANPDHNAPGQPGCFNITNLHSHGLWVSPSGNSDNVLLAINPNVNFEYEYNVPVDHPAGTFWYHPHVHGSTAMQVASGMSGALVIEGERYPSATRNGDLDTLLKKFVPAKGVAAEVMLLQQIPYACLNSDGKLNYDCKENQTGVMENFDQVGPPDAWKNSGRYTSINGKVWPLALLKEKTVYRWRLIDAGFQASVVLRIKKARQAAVLENLALGQGQEQDLSAICDGPDVMQFEVASDGLTHQKIISKTANYLQPGYRSDILFALPEAGSYCIYDDKSSNDLNGEAKSTRLMGILRASANPAHPAAITNQVEFMQSQLIAAAADQPVSVRATVIADLKNGMQLTKFVPHPAFTETALTKMRQAKKQYVTFNIAKLGGATRFMVESKPVDNAPADINDSYQPGRIDRTLILGDQQIWELGSKRGNHPFHIHVNPFQIISISNTTGAAIDPQYQDLVGTWRDTLLVKQGYKIEVATRYRRYIGEYVLHCHILEHEDQGMMQNVKVVLPDGKGGAAAGAHGNHH